MVKRIFDIVITLFLTITVFWWLIPLIGLCIYVATGMPVLFVQKRTGRYGTEFDCYKFRTMVVNEERDVLQAAQDDPRITKIGRLLRETNLDELPQFYNVLKGDMSIVGPRPHMLKHTEEFEQKLPDYHIRHQVQPGITGLAQIKGYRGPTPTYRSIFKRLQWDNEYVKKHTPLMDLWIISLTAVHVLGRLFNWNQ